MCRMQAMQEQLPAAARVLTPAGRRWRSKMLRILSNSAGDLWTFTLRHNKKGPREDGGLFCYGGERGIDSKRDCSSRFDPCGAPVAVQNAAHFVELCGGSLDLHTAP